MELLCRPIHRLARQVLCDLATRIDALAVGLSLSVLRASILIPAVMISTITFSISFDEVCFGMRFGNAVEKIGVLGGVVRIGIDVKVLLEHVGTLLCTRAS